MSHKKIIFVMAQIILDFGQRKTCQIADAIYAKVYKVFYKPMNQGSFKGFMDQDGKYMLVNTRKMTISAQVVKYSYQNSNLKFL